MIDLCRNISDVSFKGYQNESEKDFSNYLKHALKALIVPSLLYAAYIHMLILSGMHVKFEYRSLTIPIFITFNLAIASVYHEIISSLIMKHKKSKLLIGIQINNDPYVNNWRNHILSMNTYIHIYDLVMAVKYKLLSSGEYGCIRNQFIKQFTNIVETNDKKLFMYAYSAEEHFIKLNQSDLDNVSFITIVELRSSLEISDEEFETLKANFISNHALADLNDLESLKRLGIINETEYYKKLYNQEKQLKLRILWERSLLKFYFLIYIITGVITFAVAK